MTIRRKIRIVINVIAVIFFCVSLAYCAIRGFSRPGNYVEDLSRLPGKAYSPDKVHLGTTYTIEPFQDVYKWDNDTTVTYQGTKSGLIVKAWRPNPRTGKSSLQYAEELRNIPILNWYWKIDNLLLDGKKLTIVPELDDGTVFMHLFFTVIIGAFILFAGYVFTSG